MPRVHAWLSRFVGFFRKKRREVEMTDEIQQHVDLLTERNVAAGMLPHEARNAALRQFGGIEQTKEIAREERVWMWADEFLQDVRFGLRALRKAPGFTIVVVVTLALGIGATTAIFSVVDAALFQPLPYAQPEQLVSVQADFPGIGAQDVGMSQPEWQDLQHSGIFENVSPTWFDENNLTGSSQPARVRLLIVAPNYFMLLGKKPQLGRAFNPEDHSPGIIPEVIISDGLWKRVFGGDRQILDRSIRMDADLYRIVGVMPAGFDAPGRTAEERNIEIWAATSFYGAPMVDHPPRNQRSLPTAIARLKSGLTIAAAQSRVDALVASLQKQFPGDYPQQNGWRVRLVPLKERMVGNLRQSLVLLLAAVGLVLLIGCVNVANLLLARASVRAPEMALRHALGAGRTRLIRQMLTESLLLSLLGGAAGLAILFSAKEFLLRLVPDNFPRLNEISISWTVLSFALIASIVSGVIFGLAPAWQIGRLDLNRALTLEGRGTAGSRERGRTRRVLVIAEFALALTLMIAASLLLRSFWGLLNVRLGFNPQSVMTVRTRLPEPNDPKIDKYKTAAEEAPFIHELIRRCSTLPGVAQVALGDTASIPLDESLRDLKRISEGQFLLAVEGRDIRSDSAIERSSVSPEYFRLLELTLLRGRFFNESDTDNTPPVALVNEAMAKLYWPNEDPLGKRFKSTKADSPWITVVGVITNARTASLAQENIPQIYLDLIQTGAKRLAIFLRGHLNNASIPDQVREQVQDVDPTLPVHGAQTLNETVSASLSLRRFSMEMVALFALTALLLAGLGIYGVISYMVNERTHEIGIRLALGAQKQNIMRMVVGQGLRLAITGAAAGLIGALIVSQLMAGLLFGVTPTDPIMFGSVALLLVGVALLACYLPARRAIRVEPMIALRHE